MAAKAAVLCLWRFKAYLHGMYELSSYDLDIFAVAVDETPLSGPNGFEQMPFEAPGRPTPVGGGVRRRPAAPAKHCTRGHFLPQIRRKCILVPFGKEWFGACAVLADIGATPRDAGPGYRYQPTERSKLVAKAPVPGASPPPAGKKMAPN